MTQIQSSISIFSLKVAGESRKLPPMASFTSIHLTEIEINEFSSDSGFYNGVCMAMILTSAVILLAAVMQMRADIPFNSRGNTVVKTEPRIDRKRGHLLPSKK